MIDVQSLTYVYGRCISVQFIFAKGHHASNTQRFHNANFVISSWGLWRARQQYGITERCAAVSPLEHDNEPSAPSPTYAERFSGSDPFSGHNTSTLNINLHVFEIVDCDTACQGGSSLESVERTTEGVNYPQFIQSVQTYLENIAKGLNTTGNNSHVFSNENLQRLVQYDYEGKGDGPPTTAHLDKLYAGLQGFCERYYKSLRYPVEGNVQGSGYFTNPTKV